MIALLVNFLAVGFYMIMLTIKIMFAFTVATISVLLLIAIVGHDSDDNY